jgi:hypothetical protein
MGSMPGPAASRPTSSSPTQGWSWLELENRRVDRIDFGAFDFTLDVTWWLARLLVVLGGAAALTAWLVGGR